MAVEIEIRERQKNHLLSLLNIKAANLDSTVKDLQEELKRAIASMEPEDIAWVEKLAYVKAL